MLLCAQYAVFPDLKPSYEIRVLAHHTYPGGKGFGGQPETPLFSVNENSPGRRREVARKYVHRGGFPASVLSQKGVNLPRSKGKVGVLKRGHPIGGEVFAYATELNHFALIEL